MEIKLNLLFFLSGTILCLLCSAVSASWAFQLDPEIPLSRIAFGSCSNQSSPQPIWNAILRFNPQLFIWMGDNIYADNKKPARILGRERTYGPWRNSGRFSPVSEEEMEFKYSLAKRNPGYTRLRKVAQIVGTWDDHDYGLNDVGKEYPLKNSSQKLMLDFLDEPINSRRRYQSGVYTSYVFGPIGKQVKVILLDTRYHRDVLFSDGDMLGETQWKWLEHELKSTESQITIITSSIQVVPDFSSVVQPLFDVEAWSHFPRERNRLFNTIANTNRGGVVFLSGDVHFGEITRYDCGVGYPLYDITSSGLTGTQAVEEANHRVAFLLRLAAILTPSTMRVFGKNCRYKSCVYGKQNFGTIEIDWDASPVAIKMQVRDVNGNPVTGVSVLLSDLQVGSINTTHSNNTKFRRHCTLESDLPWHARYRLALIFYGTILGLLFIIVKFIVIPILKLAKRLLGFGLCTLHFVMMNVLDWGWYLVSFICNIRLCIGKRCPSEKPDASCPSGKPAGNQNRKKQKRE